MSVIRVCLFRAMANSSRTLFAPPPVIGRSVFLNSNLAVTGLSWGGRVLCVAPQRRRLTVQSGQKYDVCASGVGNGVVSEDAIVMDDLNVMKEQVVNIEKQLNDTIQDKEQNSSKAPSLSKFRISQSTIERLTKNGITHATEVQAGTFDLLYDGKDMIAKSRTGTGKTLAFALPILERITQMKSESNSTSPKCIVLAPTRELAKQVAKEMDYIGRGLGLKATCIYGGASYTTQENALRRGVDIVVGTPGRVMDHLRRGNLFLNEVKFAVLDEADEMLSMGFAQDVETVFETLPPKEERQVILFSATVPRWVRSLAAQFQKDEVVTFDAVSTGSMASTTVDHCAVRVPERDEARAALLADIIAVYSQRSRAENEGHAIHTLKSNDINSQRPRAIVFTETKREADDLATSGVLDGCGAAVLHGDVSQKQREVTLAQFRKGLFQVLVATDVAARGLDISGVEVVIQYRVPKDAESYVHRAGRTGRAGRSGTAVILYSDRETRALASLERDCRVKFSQEVAPAAETALQAAVEGVVSSTSIVEEAVIEALLPQAKEILEDMRDDNEHVEEKLAGLLAVAARRTRMEDRSVLTGESGMKTMKVCMSTTNDENTNGREISTGLVVRLISELSKKANMEEKVGLIRMCKDGSAVFDVPSENVDGLLEGINLFENRMGLHLEVAKGVPALKETFNRDRGDRSRDRRGGMRGRYSSREGGSRWENRRYSNSNSNYGSRREGYNRDGYNRDGYNRDQNRRNDGRYGRNSRGSGYGGNRRSSNYLSNDF